MRYLENSIGVEVIILSERRVLTIQEYGHIKIKLKELMEERGLRRGALSRMTGVRFEVIDKWAKGKVERMDLDVLARICFVLDCKVSDILEYEE